MYTIKKRLLRRKRSFLPYQQTYALFDASNLKASEIAKARLSLKNAKLYSAPLFLGPPKIANGCSLIMVIYENLKDFHTNVPDVCMEVPCLGITIKNIWYSPQMLEHDNTKDLNKRALALLLAQSNELNETTVN